MFNVQLDRLVPKEWIVKSHVGLNFKTMRVTVIRNEPNLVVVTLISGRKIEN